MQISMEIALEASVLILVCLAIASNTQELPDNYYNGVEDLVSETEFRSLKLQWRYSPPNGQPTIGFVVTLCELVPGWRGEEGECFERHLLLGRRNSLSGYDALEGDGRGRFTASLYGLRMLTNYSVEVEAMENHNRVAPPPVVRQWADRRREKLRAHDRILVKTKGFSAHATNCLANSSDIVVSSGPYFGGKIAVEGSADDRCCVYGNRSSPQDTYTLKIDHRLCGSRTVNDSRIDTVVVVHESSSVVTHNSRRFLVQCSFLPETFTIKAAFNVPQESEADKKNFKYQQLEEALKNADSSNDIFTYDHYRQNHVKDSRMSSEQVQSVLQGNIPGYESQMLSLLIVVIVLIIVIVMVIGFSLWCYIHAHRRRTDSADIETLSTSGSSFMAYHAGAADGDALVRPCNSPAPLHFGDGIYGHTFPRAVNPFLGNQVALVSLKPVKELY